MVGRADTVALRRRLNSAFTVEEVRQLCQILAPYASGVAIARMEARDVYVPRDKRYGALIWRLFPAGLTSDCAAKYIISGAAEAREQPCTMSAAELARGLRAFGIDKSSVEAWYETVSRLLAGAGIGFLTGTSVTETIRRVISPGRVLRLPVRLLPIIGAAAGATIEYADGPEEGPSPRAVLIDSMRRK